MLKPGTKRFYKTVDILEDASGFVVRLDGKPVKTPAGRALASPTRGLAEAIADEWCAQETHIVPETMPLTKSLNTTVDRIEAQRTAIIEELSKYAAHDLLCYRAASPFELVRRQTEAWDPWLKWAAERFGARLTAATGLTPIEQSPDALARLHDAIASHDNFRLSALHTGVTITGSAVLGLAFVARALSAEETFATAQVDEIYQAELWGRDAEAEAVRARRLADLQASRRFIALLA